ncbi:MAG: hypothetical protein ACRDWT_20095, partial [Jatrophihabitantaceae bacterium]
MRDVRIAGGAADVAVEHDLEVPGASDNSVLRLRAAAVVVIASLIRGHTLAVDHDAGLAVEQAAGSGQLAGRATGQRTAVGIGRHCEPSHTDADESDADDLTKSFCLHEIGRMSTTFHP